MGLPWENKQVKFSMGTPLDFTESPWNPVESSWSLNYKTGTCLQGKSMEYFTWK